MVNEQYCINGREFECDMRLINSYQYHDNGTGFKQWLPNTPQYIRELSDAWFKNKTKVLRYGTII